MLGNILKEAREKKLQVIFALTRTRLGQVVSPRVRISCVAILDYNGADDVYKHMVALAASGRETWEQEHQEEASRCVMFPECY